MRTFSISGLGILAFVASCAPDDTGDSHMEETDTAIVVETGEEETDLPEDIAPNYGTILGSVVYQAEENGVDVCDTITTFSGGSYAGNCEDCEFAFLIDSVMSENNSLGNCLEQTALQLKLEQAFATIVDDERLVLMSQASVNGNYNDVLSIKASSDQLDLWTMLAYEGSEDGIWSHNENSMTWTIDYTTYYENLYLYKECVNVENAQEGGLAVGTESIGSIQCPRMDEEAGEDIEGTVDVWSLTATVGNLIHISADVIDLATAGDLRMWVNGPEDCTLFYRDEEFECAFGNSNCPGLSFTASASGTYQVIIDTHHCDVLENDHVDYSLIVGIEGQDSVEVNLLEDNEPRYQLIELHHHAVGEAVVTPPS